MVENKLKIAVLESEHSLKITKKSFLILGIILLISLFSISSVNAGEFNSGVASNEIQDFIDFNTTDTELILNAGTYNGLSNLNVTRLLNISGKGNVNIQGSGGILFNLSHVNITISNLNITGYDTAIQSNTSGISLMNNKIISNGYCIRFESDASGSPLTFIRLENNSMTSTGLSAVSVNLPNFSRLDVYFDKNNITAKGYGVDFLPINVPCNNNVTFTNNNIVGTYAISISAKDSINNITIKNNNLTGNASRGLYIYVPGSNNNIILTDNKIMGTNDTGNERNGVYLYSTHSINNITITGNNVSKTPRGFYLYLPDSDNTITLTNNKVTGGSYGVYLRADSSDNNISIINNEFTGTVGNGIELYAYSSNNILLSFVGNNITGNTVALYVNVNNNLLNNLHLENNTFNAIGSNGIALDFNNTNILNNILIKGNTINSTNIGIGFYRNVAGMTVNMLANYNRIIAPIGLNFTGVTNDNSNFDYNWWGVNDISSKVINFNGINNHYVLKIINLTSLENLQTGDKIDLLLLVLNNGLTNTGAENLPDFGVEVTVNGVNYFANHNNGFAYELIVPSGGLQIVTASLDDEIDKISFSASKANVSISVEVPIANVGDTINIIVKLNKNANTISDVVIGGVTYKNVNFVNGVATIPYTITSPYTGKLEVVFVGNDGYNSNNTFVDVKFSKKNIINNKTNEDSINNTNNNKNNNNTDNNNNKNKNNSLASATMENTGNPIITVLLVLLSTLGICFTRKNN